MYLMGQGLAMPTFSHLDAFINMGLTGLYSVFKQRRGFCKKQLEIPGYYLFLIHTNCE